MSIVVSLRKFIDEMDVFIDEVSVCLNRRTGEFLSMSDEEIAAAEDDDDDSEPLPKIREALNSDDWLALPSKFDFDEYRIMEGFCFALPQGELRDELEDAIRGRGAFRRFKDRVKIRGIDKDWYQFRDELRRARSPSIG